MHAYLHVLHVMKFTMLQCVLQCDMHVYTRARGNSPSTTIITTFGGCAAVEAATNAAKASIAILNHILSCSAGPKCGFNLEESANYNVVKRANLQTWFSTMALSRVLPLASALALLCWSASALDNGLGAVSVYCLPLLQRGWDCRCDL
jgi:hypothetical protein